MALLPLTVRGILHAEHTGEMEVALVTITHPNLATPVRVSSDPTQRLSSEPLRYGTISNSIEYEFILMSAIVPDDQKGTPPRTAIVLDNVTAGLVALVRSFTSPATAEIALVLASAPDVVFQRYKRLRTIRCSFDDSTVTIDLSREPFTSEPFGRRQTKDGFPGLHGIPSA
jgi:hypothetical protein